MSQAECLEILHKVGHRMTSKEVKALSHNARSSIGVNLSRLYRHGFIKRTFDKVDKTWYYWIEHKGGKK